MQKLILRVFLPVLTIALAGCEAPKFAYKAPPVSLNATGPTILVMPIKDERTNRAMDKVLAKGYLSYVQSAIADELRSMNQFSSMVQITNETALTSADLKLTPGLK